MTDYSPDYSLISYADGSIRIAKEILIALVRAAGGTIVLDANDLLHTFDGKENLIVTRHKDPFQIILKVEEISNVSNPNCSVCEVPMLWVDGVYVCESCGSTKASPDPLTGKSVKTIAPLVSSTSLIPVVDPTDFIKKVPLIPM